MATPSHIDVNPPFLFPDYQATVRRAPTKRLVQRYDIHLQGDRETVFFDH